MKRAVIFAVLTVFALSLAVYAADLIPLYPKATRALDKGQLEEPKNPWLDDLYTIQHVDANAEFYLGSGAADDTFFITFKPLAPCSVYTVEFQWYTAGNVVGFAAMYSDAAIIEFPEGRAPERGTTDISPIGAWITGQFPNTCAGTQAWEEFDIGDPFVIGDPVSLETEIFGVGFIKGDALPNPLADNVKARGISYSYTWFGGPWTITLDHIWGSYTSDYSGATVVDVMCRVWVSYPWGMPILISDLSTLPDTYDWGGSYDVTVKLEDDNGITGADVIELVYTHQGTEYRVDLTDVAPIGDDIYGATISFTGGVYGDVIEYWVETTDDAGLENMGPEPPKSFMLTLPMHPNTDLLFVDDGLDPIEWNAFEEYFAANDYVPEVWVVSDHLGIDESVVNWGWNNIIIAGWGATTVPALDDYFVYANFLDGGGNLFFTDQDYFYANGLDPTGTFAPGDVAYDYFGLLDFNNDPSPADTAFFGESGDPISNEFESLPYWTNPTANGSGSNWSDYFTTIGDPIFYGTDDGNTYGCRLEDGFKTVYLGFLAHWGADAELDTEFVAIMWHANGQFTTLLDNVMEWFNVAGVDPFENGSPATYSLSQNFPNPYNPSTSISFTLGITQKVSLKVYNLMGQEVAELANGTLSAGPHEVLFDASNLASGIYYYKLEAGDFSQAKKMLLLK